jgi:taspase (threonine aspartase 1)
MKLLEDKQNGTQPDDGKPLSLDDNFLSDTVGAIAIDDEGNIAAGVSSGGIWLKSPGRVGEAAFFGAGCYAEDYRLDGRSYSAACSITGTGEQVMKTMFAKKLVDLCQTDNDVDDVLTKHLENDVLGTSRRITLLDYFQTLYNVCLLEFIFIDSPILKMYNEKNVGYILARQQRSGSGEKQTEFWYAHTTPSMGIAWKTGKDSKPKVSHRYRTI